MRNNPITGASYLLRGLGLIVKPGIRRFVVAPLIINSAVFALFVYFLFLGTARFSALLEGWLPDWLDWLQFLLWPLFMIAALLMIVFGFTLVGNLIAAPFNGFLAEAVEQHLTGNIINSDPGWSAIAAEVGRSIRSEIRKLGYTLVRAVPILILLWVPVVNAAASIVWIGFGAWLLTIQYADYPMANHGISFPEQRSLLAKRRLLSLGFGGAIMVALVIPVLNFLVIPASVAGATALWVDEYSKLERDTAGNTG